MLKYCKTIAAVPLLFLFFHAAILSPKMRILLGSPVAKKPEILKEFLEGLDHIKQETFTFDYLLVDDNKNPTSSQYLIEFAKKHPTCTIVKGWIQIPPPEYAGNARHYWDMNLVRKVAAFKDFIIDEAVKEDYDYLFLIDADLVLNPNTIEHLISCQKDIVAEIFWTSATPGSVNQWAPTWEYDEYSWGPHFWNKLKTPGCYEVGGLGACTLISKKALTAGVKFKEIKNLTFLGEDRHFCVRAVALGLKLFSDTYYPAFHIYYDSDLKNIEQFKRKNNYY